MRVGVEEVGLQAYRKSQQRFRLNKPKQVEASGGEQNSQQGSNLSKNNHQEGKASNLNN